MACRPGIEACFPDRWDEEARRELGLGQGDDGQ
jgi:hypothetical protein